MSRPRFHWTEAGSQPHLTLLPQGRQAFLLDIPRRSAYSRGAEARSLSRNETWRADKGVSGAPQYIILSLEVGPWAGKIADAKLPDSVLFDYVRVYKTRPAPPPQ